MAANVAVGATDPVGRVVAGWPAFALLVAIKLLSGLVDRPAGPSGTVSIPETPHEVTANAGPSSAGPWTTVRAADGSADGLGSDSLADLLPAARAVQASVAADGQRLTRAVLADRLRQQGITVSNARLAALRQALVTASARDDAADSIGGDQ